MTVAQCLVGAMGCASWRVRNRLCDYAKVAPAGGLITGGKTNPPSLGAVATWGLNEVGVTDAAMATLWRFGPGGASHAITSGAEAHHLGADIAIVHNSTSRVLLYQAKLARLDGPEVRLKSPAPAAQIRRLRRRGLDLDGRQFDVTSRLALYQIDHTPHLDCCEYAPPGWWRPWRWESDFPHRPDVGREYYEAPLRHCRCSPSGILAAPVPKTGPVGSMPAANCPGRSARHQGNEADPLAGRWSHSTLCGRTWSRMAAGADELLPLWRDPAFAPTCHGCLRILDSRFPTADTPSGVWLLAAVVAEEVTRFSSTYVTGVPVEHVEATRVAIRKVLRSGGFRSATRVVDGVVHVWSDDAYDAMDPAEIRTRVTSALQQIATGGDAAPPRDPDSTPGPVDWHTWVIE